MGAASTLDVVLVKGKFVGYYLKYNNKNNNLNQFFLRVFYFSIHHIMLLFDKKILTSF
tara:strand:+ start:392 stop:565 length:174 start_codon:yes stop_codon:yes gene_type:complete